MWVKICQRRPPTCNRACSHLRRKVPMEQRLRLVQGGHQSRGEKRTSERRSLAVAGQIVWKDARGNTKLVEVVTRDVSEHGVSVECTNGAAIPLYRLVYFQVLSLIHI